MPAKECNEIRDGLLHDPLKFLWENVIIPDSSEQQIGPGTSASRLVDFGVKGAALNGGYVYDQIAPGSTLNGLLNISYLPWKRDTGYYVVLEPNSGPEIMMTAQLSGCSVGYIRSSDGAVRVSHHNVQSGGNPAQEQNRSLAFAGNAALHPGTYRSVVYEPNKDQGQYTFAMEGVGYVFGVRRLGGWEMYFQVVKRAWQQANDGSTPRKIFPDAVSMVGPF